MIVDDDVKVATQVLHTLHDACIFKALGKGAARVGKVILLWQCGNGDHIIHSVEFYHKKQQIVVGLQTQQSGFVVGALGFACGDATVVAVHTLR